MANNKEEKARSKLSSAEPTTRIEGLQELWETLQSVLQKHLKGKIKNEQDRDDVVQDTFERLHKRLLNKSLPPNSCIEAFSVTVAEHRLIELERRRKTGTQKTAEFAYRYMEKDAPTAEEQGMEQVASEQAIALPFHLSNESELLLAVQLAHLKHKPDEIASLNGWNKQDVHNAMRRVKRELQQRREQADASVTAPSSWERKLACAPGHHAFGFSYVNIFPRNLAPKSEKALLQRLEVHDMHEAYQKYIFMLRIDNVNTAEPRGGITRIV